MGLIVEYLLGFEYSGRDSVPEYSLSQKPFGSILAQNSEIVTSPTPIPLQSTSKRTIISKTEIHSKTYSLELFYFLYIKAKLIFQGHRGRRKMPDPITVDPRPSIPLPKSLDRNKCIY